MIKRTCCFLLELGLLIGILGNMAWGKEYSPSKIRRAKFELIAAKRIFYTETAKDWLDRDLGKYHEVIKRGEAIIRKYPGTKQAEKARGLVVSCHEDLGEWDELSSTMREYLKVLEKRRGKETALKYIETKADSSYREGDYEKAIELYKTMRVTFEDDKDADAKCRYFTIRCYFQMGLSDVAEELFKEFIESKPPERWEREARLALGYLYLIENQQEEAIETFRDFLKKYPDDEKAAYAQYSIAWGFWALREKDSAFLEYGKVTKKYPKSEYAKKAGIEMKKIQDEVLGELVPEDFFE